MVQTLVGGGANVLHTPTKMVLTIRKSKWCYCLGSFFPRLSMVIAGLIFSEIVDGDSFGGLFFLSIYNFCIYLSGLDISVSHHFADGKDVSAICKL